MKTLNSILQVFQSRKMAALLFLGFASGLPLLLTSKALQAWLTAEQVDLGAIGLLSLVGLPYSLKFLWSPFLDRFIPPFLGRRRGWLIITQVGLMGAIALMSIHRPTQSLQLLAINALIITFLSASQDIAADAYRTDVLHPLEMGAGAAIFVLGYRIALLLTGGLAFVLADSLPWSTVYLLMSLLMGLGLGATLLAPEPEKPQTPPETLLAAVYLPFTEFFQRHGWGRATAILIFIIFYRYGDALVNNMSTPFLLESTGLNFTSGEVGTIQGGMGLIATIVGTLVGGAILSKIGINRSLWVFGGLQALSNLAYFTLAQTGKNYAVLVLTINVENFCGGLATAGFVAFLMSLCNPQFTATQYALLSSLMAVSRDILVAPAGELAKATGWSGFFLLSIVAAIPGLLLLPIFAPWKPEIAPMPRPGLDDSDPDQR